MSSETYEWLANNIRIGFVSKFGPAWWQRGAEALGMAEGTHFDGPVPEDEVRKILAVPLREGKLFTEAEGTEIVAPYWTEDREGNTVDVEQPVTVKISDPDRKVIYRADTHDILGIFKSGYRLHDYHEWTAGVIARVLDQTHGELQTKAVGLLKRGGQAFYQAVLPEVMTVNGFGYRSFIGAVTSADGSLASQWFTGNDAMVCDNTMYAALRGADSKLKVRHSRNSPGRVAEVQDALGLVYQEAEDFGNMIKMLCDIPVTDADWGKFLDEVAPMPEAKVTTRKDGREGSPGRAFTLAEAKREALGGLYRSDPKVAPWTGTAFGALQAMNTWQTWDRTVQGADGGRMERYYSQMAEGKGQKDDADTLGALGRVLGRDLTELAL